MPNNQRLTKLAASFRNAASSEFDRAVKKLIALAWEYGEPTDNFLWETNPEMDAKANEILRELSDNLARKAKETARSAIANELEFLDFNELWDEANGDDGGATLLFRFDMQGSHIKELLAIWIALAAVNHIGKTHLRILISRYINNPFTAPLWKGIPLDALRWGSGYSKNIVAQLAVIGQNAIVAAKRLAEWKEAAENGADYYIRRRGSNYDCKECDALCNKPIPMDVPFEFLHSNCMCYAEYHYPDKY